MEVGKMSKQTYISYLEDEDGRMIDFERWAYKKVKTIEEKLKMLYQELSKCSFYRSKLERAKTISVYATPDGYNKEEKPVSVLPISDILGG
jgi:hypothetical protein